MSTEEYAEAEAVAEAITDYEDLYVRHLGGHQYRVLNLAHDPAHAYLVDLNEPNCSCADSEYRAQLPEVCKHLAAAIERAPERLSIEEQGFRDFVDLFQEAQQAVRDIQDVRDAAQAVRSADAAHAAAEAGQSGAGGSGGGPVAQVEAWLEANGVPTDGVDVWEHEEYESVQLETNGDLSDDEFDTFRDLTDHDLVKFDSRDGVNYIQADDLEAVVG